MIWVMCCRNRAMFRRRWICRRFTSNADAVDRAAPSVISIHSTIRQQIQLPPEDEIPPLFRNLLQNLPAERSYSSLGSGVVINDKGYVLTSLHVIEGAEDIEVRFGDVNSKTYISAAKLIGSDPNTDLALLKIESADLPPPIPIGSSDAVRVGDTVLAIGFPSQELISQKSVSRGHRQRAGHSSERATHRRVHPDRCSH